MAGVLQETYSGLPDNGGLDTGNIRQSLTEDKHRMTEIVFYGERKYPARSLGGLLAESDADRVWRTCREAGRDATAKPIATWHMLSTLRRTDGMRVPMTRNT